MQARPEIELVSRDRGGDYATAARQGAPQAVQTADRFHLCKNLAEAVEKALARCRAELRKDQKAKETSDALSGEAAPAPLLTADGQPYTAHQTERYDRYQQVVTLHKQGMKIKEIASRIGMGRRTVQSWLAHDTYPETHYHTRRHRSRFDAYEAYVRQRWDEGVHNIQQIWREIKAQGYPHSDRALRAHLEALCGKKQADLPAASLLDHFSAKTAVWLLMRPFDELKENEREELLTMLQTSSMAEMMYQLVQEFLRIVHSLQGAQLDAWIAKVAASQIKELQRFAKGLESVSDSISKMVKDLKRPSIDEA